MEFSKQGNEWIAVSSSGDLPDPGIKPTSLAPPPLAGGFFTTWKSPMHECSSTKLFHPVQKSNVVQSRKIFLPSSWYVIDMRIFLRKQIISNNWFIQYHFQYPPFLLHIEFKNLKKMLKNNSYLILNCVFIHYFLLIYNRCGSDECMGK